MSLNPNLALLLSTNELEEVLLYRRYVSRGQFARFDHMKYDKFGEKALDDLTDDECWSRFRFRKNDILRLPGLLDLPPVMHAANGTKWTALEGISLVLRRLNYPKRLDDLIPEFGRHITDIGLIFNEMVYRLEDSWGFLLDTFDQDWLRLINLREFADIIHQSGCPLTNCFGFIDGTLIQTCRPRYNQQELYNGKDRVHGLKYQAVVAPNGLIANMYGPVEGRRHDATLLRLSDLMNKFGGFMPDGSPLAMYGDKAYPLNDRLITPYKGANINADERAFNEQMNKGRIAVEWAFGDISSNFAFLKFPPNQKVYLQPVGSYYRVGTLIMNLHSCCYGNQSCHHFGVNPPTLQEYVRK